MIPFTATRIIPIPHGTDEYSIWAEDPLGEKVHLGIWGKKELESEMELLDRGRAAFSDQVISKEVKIGFPRTKVESLLKEIDDSVQS